MWDYLYQKRNIRSMDPGKSLSGNADLILILASVKHFCLLLWCSPVPHGGSPALSKRLLDLQGKPTAFSEVCFYDSLFIWKCMQHIILWYYTVVCTISYCSENKISLYPLYGKYLSMSCQSGTVSFSALIGIYTHYSDFLEVYRNILRCFSPWI